MDVVLDLILIFGIVPNPQNYKKFKDNANCVTFQYSKKNFTIYIFANIMNFNWVLS